MSATRLPELLAKNHDDLLASWVAVQQSQGRRLSPSEEKAHANESREFLSLLRQAIQNGNVRDLNRTEWDAIRDFLGALSASRAKGGYTPSQTAIFVFSLKQPVFELLRNEISDPRELADEIWNSTTLLDQLGLFTTEAHQKSRDEILVRQQHELLELSTPVVRLWENILALPLIGTLDSSRTQVVMQNLLEAIVSTRSDIAIIDITGVPAVDTLVAQHLLKTVAAARLMGADCIISGIRPQIAQTIIHLGVDLSEVTTKATLADAFSIALRRAGYAVAALAKKSTE